MSELKCLTAAERAEIAAAYEKTTKGYWASPVANLGRIHAWDVEGREPTRCVCEAPDETYYGQKRLSWPDGSTERCDNLRFIAGVHNMFPRLLATIAAMEAEIADLKRIQKYAQSLEDVVREHVGKTIKEREADGSPCWGGKSPMLHLIELCKGNSDAAEQETVRLISLMLATRQIQLASRHHYDAADECRTIKHAVHRGDWKVTKGDGHAKE